MTCLTCPAFVPSWHGPLAVAVVEPLLRAPVASAAAAHAATRTASNAVRLKSFIFPPCSNVTSKRRYVAGRDAGETARKRSGDRVEPPRRQVPHVNPLRRVTNPGILRCDETH